MSASGTQPHSTDHQEKPPSGSGRVARVLFLVTAAIFALCVMLQVFIAGMATFAGPQYWGKHVNFVHIFEFLPLLMVLLAFVDKMHSALKWVSGIQFVLILYMYFAAGMRGAFPMVAATHPVVALIIFGLAIWTVAQARRELA